MGEDYKTLSTVDENLMGVSIPKVSPIAVMGLTLVVWGPDLGAYFVEVRRKAAFRYKDSLASC